MLTTFTLLVVTGGVLRPTGLHRQYQLDPSVSQALAGVLVMLAGLPDILTVQLPAALGPHFGSPAAWPPFFGGDSHAGHLSAYPWDTRVHLTFVAHAFEAPALVASFSRSAFSRLPCQ